MIKPQALREAVRTVSVNYSGVPWVIGLLFAFAFACLGLLAVVPERVSLVVEVCAGVAVGGGLAASIFGVFVKPELLRSERHQLATSLLDMFGDNERRESSVDKPEGALVEPAIDIPDIGVRHPEKDND